GEEELGLGVLEIRVLVPVQELTPLGDQRRDPGGALVQPERELDELGQLAPPLDGSHLNGSWHGRASYTCETSGACPSRRRRQWTSSRRPAPTTVPSSSKPPSRATCSPTSASWSRRPDPWWRWRGARRSCSAPTITWG